MSYVVSGATVRVRGRHLAAADYETIYELSALTADAHTYWVKNSRPAVQICATVLFLGVFGTVMYLGAVAPTFVRAHSASLLAVVGGSLLATFLTVFGRKIPVAVFNYTSGLVAFRVPLWGCTSEAHASFVRELSERIRARDTASTVQPNTPLQPTGSAGG